MKDQLYLELVNQRKSFRFNDKEIFNPSEIENGIFDYNHLNPWAEWHGDLNAEILLIGQDFGDKEYFIKNKGRDDINNKTNKRLIELFSEAGINIGTIEKPNKNVKLYFTNAVLGMKLGGMAAKIKKAWYRETAELFIKPLINIIQPKIIISMGSAAYETLAKIYNLPKNPLKETIKENPYRLPNDILLFAFYHCSDLGIANKKIELQKEDWAIMKEYFTKFK
jgi:uracil-DNA glycosylase